MHAFVQFLHAQHEYLSFLLVYYSIYLAVAIGVLAVKQLFFKDAPKNIDFFVLLSLLLGVMPLSLFFSYQPILFASNFALNIFLIVAAAQIFQNHSYAGLNFYIANVLTIIVGLMWGTWFLVTLPVSLMTKLLLSATAPLLLVMVPSGILQMFEQYDIICRDHWIRPRKPFPRRINDLVPHEPFVSIHVPTYSEPPEVVNATLDALRNLEYSNYEVILLDNNTEDTALWEPVREHCRRLGKRFRFVHVEDLPGAKGGALNFALTITDPRATLIAVVDADYHAKPEFLRALVGHFDDPSLGFVQTPHDYRGWHGNLFLTMCYWEYKLFFHSAMVGLNELDAGITVGTMCLIRKKALEKAGGWSETCVTEDSELAIRIHKVGFSSTYVDVTYGYGLIPDTFADYKKQRYRWTAGPVQEFRDHVTSFLGLDGEPSRFTLRQRLFHFNHGFHNILLGITIPLMGISIATVLSMIAHREVVAVPFELWLAATILLLASPTLGWLMFRTTLNVGFRELCALLIASKSLSHVIFYSALRTTLTGNAVWTRTSKFKSDPSYLSALYNAKEETFLGGVLIIFIVFAYIAFPFDGLTLMYLIGISYVSLGYLAAPFFSIINVYSMKKESRVFSDTFALQKA